MSGARPGSAANVMLALLRAVNVGGRSLLMTDLKALLEGLGYAGTRTVLQTGNAVLRGGRDTPTEIEQRLEAALRSTHALESAVFVRSSVEWQEIVAANPFRREAASDPARLVLMLLKATPSASTVEKLQAWIKGPEIVRAAERRLYIVYPDGQGRSKLTNTVIERTLGTAGTARNWNTVLKLASLASGE